MAFMKSVFKARNIERLRRELEDEKKKSMEASRGQNVKYTLRQKYRHFWIDLGIRVKKRLQKMCSFPKASCMHRTLYNLRHEDTCENFTLKSIVGFISGFFLTYIFFMFFVFQLNFKLSTATIMCSFFGSILTIGLAFSYKVRCVVLLLLPQFFSKRGRQALMAYAFILAITGPAKNTLHNMGILSESLACGQEQLKAAVRQIIEVIKKPFYAIRDAIRTIVKTVKVIVKQIKEILLTIKRVIMAILRVIKAAFQFLGKILNICNKELGTPFERCMRAFEDAITDCHAKLGPLFSWLCSITYLVQSVCYIVKIFDFICMIVDFISDSIIGVVVRKVKTFVRHIRTMFYVKIKFSHSFSFETNQSKSISEITTGIVTEIRHRTEKLLAVFDFMSCATSLFFLFIILRVLQYRYKFLTSERFDNRFITKNFRQIDMTRAQLEKETVLPLNHRERAMYVTVGSMRLVKSEKRKLLKAAIALGMITIKLSTHMMTDYALYWVLTVIRYHARFQSNVQAPNIVGLHVEGKGFIASLLRSIVTAFQPLGVHLEIDTIPCLPDPIPPDYDRYIQIASLLILCWILTIFEPYGLRLRHFVMCYYHPVRGRQRAIWLYNHILRSRLSFLKFARRQLKRKFTGGKGITNITCKEYLRAHINCKLLRLCLGEDKQDACVVCGEVFRETDSNKPIRCIKPGCPGIYCDQCYADLQNLCTICMEPIQYGDISDISEEKDSSEDKEEDEDEKTKQKKKNKRKRYAFQRCKGKRNRDSDDDDTDDKDNKRLLKPPSNKSDQTDSDYYTSGSTTDNSYTYQTIKNFSGELTDPKTSKFRDLEKQRVPDYVSWNSIAKERFGGESSDASVAATTSKTRSNSKNSSSTMSSISKSSSKKSVTITTSKTTTGSKNSKDDIRATCRKDVWTALLPACIQDIRTPDGLSKNRQNKELFSEEIPLSDRTTITSISPDETVVSSSETETTLIESPKKIETSTTSSLDSEIMRCPKCGKLKHTPLLNLQLQRGRRLNKRSPPRFRKTSTFIERFNKNVKYEVLYELPVTPNSAYTRTISTVTPQSPLGVNYNITVPRYNKFINYTDSFDASAQRSSKRSNLIFQENTSNTQIDKHKHIQRNKRAEEIIRNKRLSKRHVESSENVFKGQFSSTTRSRPNEIVSGNAEIEERSQSSNESIYKQKVKDYYKNINTMETIVNPAIVKKNQNTFVSFVKKIFKKTDVKSDFGKLPDSKLPLEKCEEDVSIPSPKSVAIQDSSTSSTTRSTSSRFLTDESPTSSTQGNNLRMGIFESHIRGGADTDIYSLQQTATTTTSTTDSKTSTFSPKNNHRGSADINSSDSDLTNADIILGCRRKNKNWKSRRMSPEPVEEIPRYRRQPAERDQDPQFQHSCKNIMYENTEITPRGIENIRGRCSTYPSKPDNFFNSGILKDNYRNPTQTQKAPCYIMHRTPRERSKSVSDHLQERHQDSNGKRRSNSPPENMYSNRIESIPSSTTEDYCNNCLCKVTSKTMCCNCTPDMRQNEEPRKNSLERHHRESTDPAFVENPGNPNCQNQYCTCNSYQISSPRLNPRRMMEDEVSCCSGYSGRSEFPELVYQNTDEFLELVNELGDTLSLRNKERVERTIQEFEYMSSQNRNLDKPIFDSDSDDQRQPQNQRRRCCPCSRCNNKKHQDLHPCKTRFTRFDAKNDGPIQQSSFQQYHRNPFHEADRFYNFSNAQCNTRWQMNPRTGKWYKRPDEFSYDDDNFLPSASAPPPRQTCMCERRNRSRNPSERNDRSYTGPSPSFRCNNCGFPCEPRY